MPLDILSCTRTTMKLTHGNWNENENQTVFFIDQITNYINAHISDILQHIEYWPWKGTDGSTLSIYVWHIFRSDNNVS